MEQTRVLWLFLFFLVILAHLNTVNMAHAGRRCKAGKAIKVSWKMGVDPPDYQTFKIQVKNTCGVCDAHNVNLNLTMLAPGIWDPIVEKVRVRNGKSIRAGKNVTFSYHVDYLADIGGVQTSAKFINCKLPHPSSDQVAYIKP